MERYYLELLKICNSIIENSHRDDTIQSVLKKQKIDNSCVLTELVYSHKLFLLLQNMRFKKANCNESETCYYLISHYKDISDVHWAELKRVTDLLLTNNCTYSLVKGVSLSNLLYLNPYSRGIGDIDIVVKDDEINKALDLLLSDGYVRSQAKNLKSAALFYGIHHHEISLEKDCSPYKVFVEIKRSTSALNSFDTWWQHVTRKNINGLELNILEEDYEILHLLLSTFINNESYSVFQDCYLRDYFDVAYAIKHVNFSWQVVLDAAEDMKVTHQIAAVLRSVKELFSAVGEQVDEVLSLIEKKYCKYEQTLFYYGMDKFEPTNYGLVENRPRADMSYSMFDRDFSTYQWNKSYRAVLYSKKNPDYLKRVFLPPNESTVLYPYRNEAGIHANYRFFRRERDFIIEVNIEHTCKEIIDKNRCNIDVTWYNSDINSPTIYLKSHSPEIQNLETIDWDTYVDGEQCIGYYSGEEYARIMDAEDKIPAHITSLQEGDITRVYFTFDKDQLFYPLDVLLLEVKFVFAIAGDEEDILIDQGTVEHFIECVDYSK